MKFTNKIRNIANIDNQILETEEKKEKEPLQLESIEKTIKLIETAYDVGCAFSVVFELSIGDFKVDSDSYKGIKLSKKKGKDDELIISHSNALLSVDTTIRAADIVGIIVDIKFCENGDLNV